MPRGRCMLHSEAAMGKRKRQRNSWKEIGQYLRDLSQRGNSRWEHAPPDCEVPEVRFWPASPEDLEKARRDIGQRVTEAWQSRHTMRQLQRCTSVAFTLRPAWDDDQAMQAAWAQFYAEAVQVRMEQQPPLPLQQQHQSEQLQPAGWGCWLPHYVAPVVPHTDAAFEAAWRPPQHLQEQEDQWRHQQQQQLQHGWGWGWGWDASWNWQQPLGVAAPPVDAAWAAAWMPGRPSLAEVDQQPVPFLMAALDRAVWAALHPIWKQAVLKANHGKVPRGLDVLLGSFSRLYRPTGSSSRPGGPEAKERFHICIPLDIAGLRSAKRSRQQQALPVWRRDGLALNNYGYAMLLVGCAGAHAPKSEVLSRLLCACQRGAAPSEHHHAAHVCMHEWCMCLEHLHWLAPKQHAQADATARKEKLQSDPAHEQWWPQTPTEQTASASGGVALDAPAPQHARRNGCDYHIPFFDA